MLHGGRHQWVWQAAENRSISQVQQAGAPSAPAMAPPRGRGAPINLRPRREVLAHVLVRVVEARNEEAAAPLEPGCPKEARPRAEPGSPRRRALPGCLWLAIAILFGAALAHSPAVAGPQRRAALGFAARCCMLLDCPYERFVGR